MLIEISQLHRFRHRRLSIFSVTAMVVTILSGAGMTRAQSGKEPIVTGPITSGSKPNAFMASLEDLKAAGYMEQEFFVEGVSEGKLRPDDAVSSQPYKIRILVRRPVDSKRFKGT